MNMNSLNNNNTSDSLQNEVKRHGLASAAIGATADSEKKEGERDKTRTSARGGARRKVLPPIASSSSLKSKVETDPLESVLPLPNTRPIIGNMDTTYKGNLPTLTLNAPMTSQQPNPVLSHLLTPCLNSRECSPNNSVEIQTWDSFDDASASNHKNLTQTSSPISDTSSTTSRRSPVTSDTAAFIHEPPISPLPTQYQLLQDSPPTSATQSVRENRLKPRAQYKAHGSEETKRSRSKSAERNGSNGSTKSSQRRDALKKLQDSKVTGNALSFKQFRSEAQKWKKSGSSSPKSTQKLQEFYKTTFDSFTSINDTFKRRNEHSQKAASHQNRASSAHQLPDPLVEQKFVGAIYETLMDLPQEIQKIVLKGIINCLLNEWQGTKSHNEIRAYFILLQCPLFVKSSTFVIYAHLLRQIATLHEKEQSLLSQWLRSTTSNASFTSDDEFVTLEVIQGESETLSSDAVLPVAAPQSNRSSFDEEERETATPQRKRLHGLDEVDKELLQHMKRAKKNDENPRRMFLLSLLPLLERVPPEKLLDTEMKLLNVFKEE